MDIRERNALANKYRRELGHRAHTSPYRAELYIDARIAGKSHRQALAIMRVKPT